MNWLTWQDAGTAIFWGIIIYVFLVAFHYWANNPRLSLNWEDDEQDSTSHYNRMNESHLRLVRGEYPPQSEGWESQAFSLDFTPRPDNAA